MNELDEIRERYGISKEVSVHTYDYESIPTPDLIGRIEELGSRVVGSPDETLDESIEINELHALEEELSRREREGVAVLRLDDDLASLMTPSRLRILSILRRSDGFSSVRELAEKLGRPEKSVSRDVEALTRYGLIRTMEVSDRRGRRREVSAGASKVILVPEDVQDTGALEVQ